MAAAAGEALGGMDLTSLFVNVVPSFSGMGEAMKEGGSAAAGAFGEAFKSNVHLPASGLIGGSFISGFAEVGSSAAEAFTGAFGSLMKGQMPDLMSGFDLAETTVTGFVDMTVGKIPLIGGIFEKTFSGMLGVLDAFKGPAGEFMNELLDVGEKWQERSRTIAGQTDLGSLPELLNITKQLGAEGLPNLDMVANSIGQVHQRMEGLSDEQLKEFMRTLAQTSELMGNVKISTEALTGTFNAFKVAPGDSNQALIELGNTARLSGMPINELLMQLERSDVGLSAFGFNIQQAGSMLADLNKHGIQAPRVLQAFTTAAGKFIAKGLTPEEGFKDLVDTVKHDLSIGTKDAAEDAMKHLKDIFGAKNAEMVFQGIKDNLIDLPNLIQPLGDINEGPEKALAATETLHDKLLGLKTQLETALEPLGTGLANALTGAGTKFSEWIQLNQDKLIHGLHTVVDFAVPMVGNALSMMGHMIQALAPYLNIIKSVVLDLTNDFFGLIQPLVKAAALVHFPGAKEAEKSLEAMRVQVDQLSKIDISRGARDLSHGILAADDALTGMQPHIDNTLTGMENNAKIAEALKQHVTDTATGADQLKDAFSVEGDNLKLVGSPEQIQATKDRMKALGLDITTGPEGVVTQVTAGNEQIKKDFDAWMKAVSAKPLNVKTQLDPTAPRTLTPDDLMDALGVPKENRFHSEGGIQLPVRLTAVPNPAGVPPTALATGGQPTGVLTGGTPGGGVPLINQGGTWTSPNPAWAHLIMRESSGNPTITQQIVDVNTGGNEAEGLFQITPQTWRAHGGTEFAPSAKTATPQAQAVVAARILRANPSGSDWGAGISGRESASELLAGIGGQSGGAIAGYQFGGEVFGGLLKGIMEGLGAPKELENILGLTKQGSNKPTVTLPARPQVGLEGGGHSLIAHPTEHAAKSGPHVGLEESAHSVFKYLGGATGFDEGGPGGVSAIITIAPWKIHQLIGGALGGAGLNQGLLGGIGAHQDGGDVPWMPGTQWGQDGVHALLAPGEHIWEEPAVRGAGGHGAMAAMRQAAKSGQLAKMMGVEFGSNRPWPVRGLKGGGTLDTAGAQVDTIAIAEAVSQAFGITDIGMYRAPDGYNEHSSGEAADVMVGAVDNPIGNQIVAAVLAAADQYGIEYCIWENKLWYPGGRTENYGSTGSVTDQHRDHVHIRTKGGGYPPGGGPGAAGTGGSPRTGETSSTPAPAAAGMAGGQGLNTSLSVAGTTGPGGLGSTGLGGPGGSLAAAGPTPEETRRLAQMDERIKKTKEKLDAANAELDKLLAEPPEEQALDRDKIDKATKKRDKLQEEYDDQLGKRNDAQATINERDTKRATKAAGKGGEGGEYESMSEKLGGGLIKGMFQELGFPDVFGKAFTDWGIWKLAMGGLGYGAGLLQRTGLLGGTGGPGGTSEGILGGGQGGGLGGMQLPGIATIMGQHGTRAGQPPGPGQPGQPGPMAPGEAPAAVPSAAVPGPQGGITFQQTNNGITTAPQVGAVARDFMTDTSRYDSSMAGVPG